jgi:hypothetical protein
MQRRQAFAASTGFADSFLIANKAHSASDIVKSAPAFSAPDTNYVRQSLGELHAGKPLSAATTRPYGCSIKYKS